MLRRLVVVPPSLRFALLAVLVGISAFTQSLGAEDWPRWRGPSGTGASNEPRLPERWSDRENVAWRVPLGGLGVSSPIVWGERVFVVSQTGSGASRLGPRLGQGADAVPGERSLGNAPSNRSGDGSVQFLIEAFNPKDGRRLWEHRIAAEGDLPPVHDKHNLASASPTTDGERVYAVFGTGQVVSVDTAGKRVWTRHLGKEFGDWNINWGNGSSPLVHRGTLFVVAYQQAPAYLIALDARTGKQIWKQDRPSGVTSYSTPVVVPAAGGEELIVNSSTGVEAYDPATGKELWHLREDNRFPIPVAMYNDGLIYLSRGYRSGPYAAIRPGGRGDISKSHVVWRVPTGAPYISSLVFYEGLLFMAGDVGVVTCVDAVTGERVWRERLGGVYTASPVAGDGKIYLMSETGETIVLKAGRVPEVMSRNTLDARILASPAISQGRLFIRTDDQLIAIGS